MTSETEQTPEQIEADQNRKIGNGIFIGLGIVQLILGLWYFTVGGISTLWAFSPLILVISTLYIWGVVFAAIQVQLQEVHRNHNSLLSGLFVVLQHLDSLPKTGQKLTSPLNNVTPIIVRDDEKQNGDL